MISPMILGSALDSLQLLFGTMAIFELQNKPLRTRVLFEHNPSTIDAQSGLQVISSQSRLTIKATMNNKQIVLGTKVTVKKKTYRVKSVFLDESRGVIVCELAQQKN